MNSNKLPSKSAVAEVRKLGESIAIARKRRHTTQRSLADAASVTPETIRRLEKGEPGISIGILAMVLLALGERGRLSDILTPITDDIGVIISVNDLPKRVRAKRKSKELASKGTDLSYVVDDGKYVGF